MVESVEHQYARKRWGQAVNWAGIDAVYLRKYKNHKRQDENNPRQAEELYG